MAKAKTIDYNAALARLVALIAEGYVYRNAIQMVANELKLKPDTAAYLGYLYDTRPESKDHNARFRIFNITLKNSEGAGTTNVRVYLLNVGDNFARFNGSRHGLTVQKKASLIVQTISHGTDSQTEYDLCGQADTWAWIQRLILREAGVKVPDEE